MTDKELLLCLEQGIDPEEELYKGDDATWLYHFSEMRWNLLEWFPFQKGATIAQLGCGLGDMLGLFSQKGMIVKGITPDDTQTKINEIRFRDDSNIQVQNADLFSIDRKDKFDYVYVEGGKESGKKMLSDYDDIGQLLCKSAELLNDHGTMLLAWDNPLGISHLAGDKDIEDEESLAERMHIYEADGILQDDMIQTIEKLDLEIESIYYPLPNYRLPAEIYSREYLPKEGSIRGLGYGYGQKQYRFFSEEDVFDEVCRSGCFDKMANSYLIVARKRD